MQIYNAQIFSVDSKETRRYAGLNRAENFDETKILEACDDARVLISPRSVWEVYSYDCENQLVNEKISLHGKSIGKHLIGCEKIICLSATVGIDIENEITSRFNSGSYTDAILLDAAATSAVEQVANSLENSIKQTFSKQGYKTRWRFSPGYGDFPLEDQTEVFKLACADKIGIELTESMMLEPRKSITAVIGLYKSHGEENIETRPKCTMKPNCSECSRVYCEFRNRRSNFE